MPIVTGTQQVSPNTPRPTFFDYYGQFGGASARMLLEAILRQQFSSPRIPGQPTPQTPGNLTFPSGASTPTSPGEMSQIGARGGVPTTSGRVLPTNQPGGVRYTPPPSLTLEQLQGLQAQQKMQQDAQMHPVDLAYKQAQASSLTPEFQANVLRRLEAIANGQPAGPSTVPQGMPYPTSYRTKTGLSFAIPPPPGEVQRQMDVERLKAEQRPNPDIQKLMVEAKSAKALIGTIFDQADRYMPATESSGTNALAKGLVHGAVTAVGGDEEARGFKQTLRARLRSVARGLQERGVITDRDIDDMARGMPDFPDSKVSRPIKRQTLMESIDATVNAFSREKYGQDVLTPETAQGSRKPLPEGAQLAPGPHTDAQGRRILVHEDGTYESQ